MRSLLISALLLAASAAAAIEPDEVLADPALEARARDLSREIRCVVCQSESIDDSNAPLARDLRILIRERISAGDSDGEVRAFLVERYGDFVLLKPRMRGNTLLLWFAPIGAALTAAGAAVLFLRRKRNEVRAAPLTVEEQAALAALEERA
jgi:cytochrome c-type biogenesis protein CcmH